SVIYAYNNKLVNGVGTDMFDFASDLTRAQLWTVLYRVAGSPTVANANSNVWYDAAMKWAVANGITDGTNANGNITREQLAAILYRSSKSPAVSNYDIKTFKDTQNVSSWAKNAMVWAVEQGIITEK